MAVAIAFFVELRSNAAPQQEEEGGSSPSSLQLLALHKKEEEEANVACGAALQRYVSCAAWLHKQTK